MSLKNTEVDDKEMELETWPAFVDILSSTVVAIAFAFFILVVLLSMSKITTSSSSSEDQKSGSTSDDPQVEATIISEKSSQFPRLSIVAPPTAATNSTVDNKNVSKTDSEKVIRVPEDAPVTNNQQKIVQPGSSDRQVLGEVPKLVDSRSMDVLKELVVVQQDVIAQQRKVIDQQDTEIQQTTREYQSLLAVVTKEKEVEDIRQKINPKKDKALFNNIEKEGTRISGVDKSTTGSSNYLLSPPEVQVKQVDIQSTPENGLVVKFNDNSDYFNKENMSKIQSQVSNNIDLYKNRGVTISSKNSDFAISGSESRRISVNRLVLMRSVLVSMGVNPSLIKINTVSNKTSEVSEEESYGLLEIIPNEN